MTRIVWTEPAVADLAAIVEFIARDSAVYASAMANRLLTGVERLAVFPRSGRMVPEDRRRSVREVIVGRYRVLYRVRRVRIEILALIHGARPRLPRDGAAPWRSPASSRARPPPWLERHLTEVVQQEHAPGGERQRTGRLDQTRTRRPPVVLLRRGR